jgi:hypothetical protein
MLSLNMILLTGRPVAIRDYMFPLRYSVNMAPVHLEFTMKQNREFLPKGGTSRSAKPNSVIRISTLSEGNYSHCSDPCNAE